MNDARAGELRVHVEDGIGWIISDHPSRDNALSLSMMRAMPDILAGLEADPTVRVLVVRGAGERAFSSGGDISEFKEHQDARTSEEWAREITETMLVAWTRVSKPVIGMINGICFGGGLVVALYADIRIAGDHATFCIPPARLGTGYPYNLVKLVVDRTGPAHAAELLLTGNRYTAEQARAMGLVNRVVPREELDVETRKLARTIAQNAPLTLKSLKRSIIEILADPSKSDNAAVAEMVNACLRSEDFREGAAAFMAKRRPVFRGV